MIRTVGIRKNESFDGMESEVFYPIKIMNRICLLAVGSCRG